MPCQTNTIEPVPEVNTVTLSEPTVDVERVSPASGFDSENVDGYRKITMPDPPDPADVPVDQLKLPPPPPVFVDPFCPFELGCNEPPP